MFTTNIIKQCIYCSDPLRKVMPPNGCNIRRAVERVHRWYPSKGNRPLSAALKCTSTNCVHNLYLYYRLPVLPISMFRTSSQYLVGRLLCTPEFQRVANTRGATSQAIQFHQLLAGETLPNSPPIVGLVSWCCLDHRTQFELFGEL